MSPPLGEGSEVAGKYRVVRHLGTGGMGQVYAALDLTRNETVALKLLPGDKRRDALAKSRLVLEGRAAAGLRHPGIVRIHEVSETDEVAYVAMELLEGEDLAERMHRCGPLPVDEVIGIARALLEAMAAMHDADIIHRDLKPRNLFLARGPDGQETLKVLDFGIAKRLVPTDASLTDSGQQFGTLHYMAPEQLRGVKHADVRTELWAAGAILYEALAGEPPFEADSGPELVLKIAIETPVPLKQRRPDVPDGLRRAIARAMQREPAARYASARAMLAALDEQEAADTTDLAADTRPVSPDLLEQLEAIQQAEQHARVQSTPVVGAHAEAPRTSTLPAPVRSESGRVGSWLVAASLGALLVAGMTHGSAANGVTSSPRVASASAPSPLLEAPARAQSVVAPPARAAAEPTPSPGACEASCAEHDGPALPDAPPQPHERPEARSTPRRRSARTVLLPVSPPAGEAAPASAALHPAPSSAGELRRDDF